MENSEINRKAEGYASRCAKLTEKIAVIKDAAKIAREEAEAMATEITGWGTQIMRVRPDVAQQLVPVIQSLKDALTRLAGGTLH